MDTKKLLIGIIIILFGISIIANVYQSCQQPKVVSVKEVIDTVSIRNQFKSELETKLRAELKPIIITKKISSKVNYDSLKLAIDTYWKNKISAMQKDTSKHPDLGMYDYYAYADTSLHSKDSTAFFSASYYSRIPLDPEGKLSVEAIWYNRDITHTIETTITEQKSFWQRFKNEFELSYRNRFLQNTRTFNGSVSSSFTFNHFEVFGKGGIELNLERNDLYLEAGIRIPW